MTDTPTRRKDGSPTVPARGYSWPPFERGNVAGMVHGAFSDRVISPRAASIREMLIERYPYLADDVFTEALERYARAEARSLILNDFVMEKAATEGVEAVRPYLWTEAARADSNAAKFGQDCGLDAAGHAKIARELGVASHLGKARLDTLLSTGRELRQRRTESRDHG